MVEVTLRPKELILNQKNPVSIILVKQDSLTSNIIGVKIYYQEKSLQFPDQNIFDQDKENTTNFQVNIPEETYFNEIQIYESIGCIQKIQFKLHYIKDNRPLRESYVAGQCQTSKPSKIFSANGGHSLTISKLRYTNVLVGLEVEQKLLPNFAPSSLISKFSDVNQNFLFNFRDIKKLEGLIPKKGFVEDQEFKELYESLRKAIIQIDNFKKELSDVFQENVYLIRRLEETYQEVASSVWPVLKRGAGRFRPEEEACSTATELRASLLSNEGVSQLLRLYKTEESISFSQKSKLEQIRKELKHAKEQLDYIEKMLQTIQIQADSLTQMIKQKEEQKLDFSKKSSSTDQQLQELKEKDFQSIEELGQQIQKLQDELQNNCQELEQDYKNKKHQIEEQIMKERSQISSQNMKAKENNHFIFILDESGSMSSDWQALRKTFNDFIYAYKDNEDDIFSVILFDNGGRIAFKRRKAKDIDDIGQLSGGGTQFFPAMQIVKQIVDLTPNNMTPIMIFMTDGGTDSSDLKSACKVLEDIANSQVYKNKGIFFTIGFGTGYQMQTLQSICQSANNKKTYVQMGENKIDLIMEAINGEELHNIFMGISNAFDCSAQEAAIHMLEKQRELDENTYKSQLKLFTEQKAQRLEQLKQHAEMQASLKKLATEGKTQELQDFLEQRIKQYSMEIEQMRNDMEAVRAEEAKLTAEKELMQKQFDDLSKQEEQFKQKLYQQEKEESKNEEHMQQKTNLLVARSNLQDIEGVRTMFNYLGSVEGIVENLNTSFKSSKNLLIILKSKIDDLIYQFEGHFVKTVIKGLEDSLIAMRIIESYELPSELMNKQSRDVLEEVLMKSSQKQYEENKEFYNILLKVLDLGALTTASRKKLGKYAKEYAQKLKIKESSGALGDDTDEDSDDDNSDDSSGSDKGASKATTKDIQKDNPEIEIEPLYKDEYEKVVNKQRRKLQDIRSKKAAAKKNMSKEEYNNEKKKFKKDQKELKNKITYYRKRLDETQLIQTIEECLRNIYEILQKAIGKDISTRVFDKFKIIFEFFMKNVEKKLLPYEDSANYLTMQNESEIERAIEDINQRKVQQALEGTVTLENKSTSVLSQVDY